MFKNKIKLAKNIITGLILTLVVTVNLLQPYIAHAADPAPVPMTCDEAGLWKPIEPDRCMKPGKMDPPSCTGSGLGGSFELDLKQTNDTQTVCIKKTQAENQQQSGEVLANLAPTINILVGIQQFLNKAIWPVLVMIGDLMGNDLLFSGGMEERLREVWIPMRNLVNILFIIVLVGIALYNVLGLGEDGGEYALKTALPKIIVGIIAINFSFLAIKVTLDGINVLTTAVFSLPSDISPALGEIMKNSNATDETGTLTSAAQMERKKIRALCSAVAGYAPEEYNQMNSASYKQGQDLLIARKVAAGMSVTLGPNDKDMAAILLKVKAQDPKDTTLEAKFTEQVDNHKKALLCYDKQDQLTPQAELFLRRYNSRNAALALAINMGEILFYQDIDLNSIASIEKVFVNTIFSMILYLVYMASFLALFVVLLGRLVVLWLCIAVSPILLLVIAAPSLKDKFGGFDKLSEAFTKNAIAPLMMALSMTIGWIMLNALKSLNPGGKFYGTSTVLSFDPTVGIPVAGMNTLQDLTVATCTIAVVWLGVFSAAEGTIAEGVTGWMKEKLITAAKFIGSVPLKHIPLVPIQLPNHEHHHYTLSQVGRALENAMHSDDSKLINDMGHNKVGSYKDFEDISTKEEFIDHIKRMDRPEDMTEEKYIKALQEWSTGDGREIMEKFNRSPATSDEKELHRQLTRMMTNPDQAKDAARRIKNDIGLTKGKPDGKPAPAATTGTANQVDATGAVAGAAAGSAPITAVVNAANDVEKNKKAIAINADTTSVINILNTATPNPSGLRASLNKLGSELGTTGPTAQAEKRALFTPDQLKKIKTVIPTIYDAQFGPDPVAPPVVPPAAPPAPPAPHP
ncbi:MAG: hypothetical protein AAB373_02990 [Patescibacteria group bacterium]